MKMHSDRSGDSHRITAYGSDYVAIDGEVIRHSLVVLPDRLVRDWLPVDDASIDLEAIRALTLLGAEIVLLGTGRRQRFPPAEHYAAMNAAGIGLEVMDTAAACRTYNILAGEGRLVAAALVVGGE